MRPAALALSVIVLSLLAACVLPGAKPARPAKVNPITGAAVTVEPLEAPAPQGMPAEPAFKPAPTLAPTLASPVAGQVDASLDAITAAEAVPPKPAQPKPAQPKPEEPRKPTDEAAEAQPSAPEEAAVTVAPPDSPEAAKCLKSGGAWATAGKSGAKACVQRTKDAGKACTRQTQCEGFCLARSGTCAPITPMFGCNDILQADGREVTLCLD